MNWLLDDTAAPEPFGERLFAGDCEDFFHALQSCSEPVMLDPRINPVAVWLAMQQRVDGWHGPFVTHLEQDPASNAMLPVYMVMPERPEISIGEIILRPARPDDYQAFYGLRCDPPNIAWTGYASVPNWNKLREWYEQTSSGSSDHSVLLIEAGRRITGYAYAIDTGQALETAISIDSCYAGRGLATAALKQLTNFLGTSAKGTIEAWIFSENRASVKAHERAGYRLDLSTPGREITLPAITTRGKMLCWRCG